LSSTLKKVFLTFPVVILLSAVGLAPSLGHTSLVASNPEAGAVLAEIPNEITLTFDEPLLIIEGREVNYMTLHNPLGQEVAFDEMQVDETQLSGLIETSEITKEAVSINGKYHLTFRVAGEDGHVIKGEFSFLVSSSDSVDGTDGEDLPAAGEGVESDSVTGAQEVTLLALIGLVALAMVFIYLRAGRESSS
jgi:methionine-rich copper-binding protein CopC